METRKQGTGLTRLKGPVFAKTAGRGRAKIEASGGWRIRGPRLEVPSGPVRSRTPPAGQGRGRRGLPRPFRERWGSAPETGRGRAARPGQHRRRPREADEAARANTSRGPPAGSPASPRRPPPPGESFALGPPGAPGGPRAALTGGGQQGAKVIAGEAPSAGHRFPPNPTPQAAAAAAAEAAAAAATPAPESAAAVAAAPLPLRSPLPLRPEPRPTPAPAPHWAGGARGCPGRPRGALMEGGGRREETRTPRTQSGEGAGGGGRKWGRGARRRSQGRERVGTWGLGEMRAWASLSPRCCALCLGSEPGRTRTTVTGVIRSLPTQKGIATGSEAEVSPLSPCALGILDLGRDRNCSSLNFRLVFPLTL